MDTMHMTPSRRLQLAGLGYLMLYIAGVWHPQGLIAALVAALLFVALALVLLRAAKPEEFKPDEDAASHPVQAGKRSFLHRNRLLRRTVESRA